MELIEQDRGDAVQRRIVQDHAGEHTLGHHLNPGGGRDLRLHPHPKTNPVPDRLAQGRGHARGGGAGGEAAGLQDDDLAALHPRLIHQRQGNYGGLAGAGGRRQHRDIACGKRRFQGRQSLMDRQHGRGLEPYRSARQRD